MEINPEILQYVSQHILPKYEHFDKAHNTAHADKVIQNSLKIAADYDVDIDKVYVIAAYHDTGLIHGRGDHEKHSAKLLLADLTLLSWFSADELTLMAEAIEDHRASSDNEPRSIYGKIVSEADRDIEYMTILARIVQFSLENYKDFTVEQHYARTYEHMQEKYGENGYLKLWLDTEDNRNNLIKLREVLRDEKRFRADFYEVFERCGFE